MNCNHGLACCREYTVRLLGVRNCANKLGMRWVFERQAKPIYVITITIVVENVTFS